MPTQQRGRSLYLDYAKAIGILLVVVGHARFFGDAQWATTLNEVIYSFHMPLFLFVSGYVYIRFSSGIGYAATVRKKSLRLIVPYLTMSVLLIAVKLCSPANDATVSPVTPMSFVHMFYRPEAGFYLWFIYTLWVLFLVIPLFSTVRSRLCLLALLFVAMLLPVKLPDVMCVNQLKNLGFFFVLGCVAADNDKVYVYLMRQRIAASALMLAGILAIVLWPGTLFYEVALCLMPLVGTLWTLQLSRVVEASVGDNGGAPRMLLLVAAAVYFIYLFHTLLMGAYIYAIGGLVLPGSALSVCAANVGLVVVGLLAPTALFWLMRRYPSFLNLLFGIGGHVPSISR